jgi:hypothetical protein
MAAGKIASSEPQLRFQNNLVYKTPHPVFTRFDGLHDGMFAGVKMFSGVFIFRGIATTHVSALSAQPQVNPGIAHF